ncbi:hypothetical protein BT63DRAFT_123630 [Microthyrium microscopicum]|uniref:Uncharacterized protein n=1 Tax=Microthyrium microscopicum TaxID=703497 RepID=A0A6A6TVD1_9PEZI|nr:hypothetical protein BT63DRAFT_123630 [Microthyrium microscopicum]
MWIDDEHGGNFYPHRALQPDPYTCDDDAVEDGSEDFLPMSIGSVNATEPVGVVPDVESVPDLVPSTMPEALQHRSATHGAVNSTTPVPPSNMDAGGMTLSTIIMVNSGTNGSMPPMGGQVGIYGNIGSAQIISILTSIGAMQANHRVSPFTIGDLWAPTIPNPNAPIPVPSTPVPIPNGPAPVPDAPPPSPSTVAPNDGSQSARDAQSAHEAQSANDIQSAHDSQSTLPGDDSDEKPDSEEDEKEDAEHSVVEDWRNTTSFGI